MQYNEKEYRIENCSNEDKRSRNWACLVYPDSCNPDFIDIIKQTGVKCAVSPLHNKDIFDKGDKIGEYKKPHYHLLFKFNSGYRLSDFASIVDSINGDSTVVIVRDINVYHDYLYHKDEPNKHIYDCKDIKYINSNKFDFVTNEFKEILNYIDDNKIGSFITLTKKLRRDEQDNLLLYVSKNPYYISTYIKDYNNEQYNKILSLFDIVNKMCNNLLENKSIDYEVINTVKKELKEFGIETPEDVPF